ncbi:PiggyBac transposable element-derived protein 4 [Anthophora retusa]
MLHFTNNETADVTKRLWKIQPILDELNKNFKKYYNPAELICIDESMIPFRRRIVFRQFMKQKRHKYEIKIFKLCCGFGYTYNFRVYSGKMSDEVNTTPTNIVMNLCQDIFHKGHTAVLIKFGDTAPNVITRILGSKLGSMLGSKMAKNLTQKVSTFCNECKSKPYLCLSCFNKLH